MSRAAPTDSTALLGMFVKLCDDLAWGRPADEDALFALTREGAASSPLVRLAEAFGMMIVKVEAREYHRNQLIEDLRRRNAELEAARALLAERHSRLAGTLQETYSARRIVGSCDRMRQVVDLALSIARRPINTLILGPTGSGKEVIAKTIHFNSPRREGPFVAVNCTAIPDSLFESEMFGIEKGVATGVSARKGLVEEADGGTLFLDELADMPLPHQAKLLRVLEEREVLRVGSSRPVPVDIKVIAATNVRLMEAVRAGRFREDLYYRINVAEIRLPPLAERGDDVLLLARHFMDRHCTLMGRPCLVLAPDARRCLLAYDWPGNVRELNNEMERAAALTLGDVVHAEDLSPRLQACVPADDRADASSASSEGFASGGGTAPPQKADAPRITRPDTGKNAPAASPDVSPLSCLPFNLEDAEAVLIDRALNQCGGNKSRAADLLGITREGLRKKLLRRAAADGTSGEKS